MKLRTRLLTVSSIQLLLFGALFAVSYWKLETSVIPMVQQHMHDEVVATTRELAGELDVALGADDRVLLERVLQPAVVDSDFHYVEVRDAHGTLVVAHGDAPASAVMTGTPRVAHADAGLVRAWSPVTLEGIQLGSVAVVLDTARTDDLESWTRMLAGLALAVWLLVFIYSIVFARSFVAPIRAMKLFAERVAAGWFGEQLVATAPGELGELKAYLNSMSADLDRREQARVAAAWHTEAMQRELLAVSRMAGMAEVATGVLHDVGNVLNSLNVSVSVVRTQLQASKLSALRRTVELFDKHPGGLAEVLTTDKGKLVPAFLASVTQRLAEENATAQRELDSVARNVDHIKTIVAAQQSYALVSTMRESFEAAELVDEALRMVEASFAKHGVELVREYEPVPPLLTDRHKLLQILVNLVTNARHAIRDGTNARPRLTARISATDAGIAIAVIDTGVGIPAENLARVFQHGFTTKRNGHGFGLHSSGNAVRELGGSIAVASDGPGLGATFTVTLPQPTSESAHASTN